MGILTEMFTTPNTWKQRFLDERERRHRAEVAAVYADAREQALRDLCEENWLSVEASLALMQSAIDARPDAHALSRRHAEERP